MNIEKEIFMARLAEQAERFEDMTVHMTNVVKVSVITVKERMDW